MKLCFYDEDGKQLYSFEALDNEAPEDINYVGFLWTRFTNSKEIAGYKRKITNEPTKSIDTQ